MSDPMNQLKEMRSTFNPADMSMEAQEGGITQGMSVEQFLTKLGIDVKGPVDQLKSFFMKNMQNANPLAKMQGLAGGAPPGAPPGGAPPGMPPGGGAQKPFPQGSPSEFQKLF